MASFWEQDIEDWGITQWLQDAVGTAGDVAEDVSDVPSKIHGVANSISDFFRDLGSIGESSFQGAKENVQEQQVRQTGGNIASFLFNSPVALIAIGAGIFFLIQK